jgi:tetratricopeptide (TPR) repeat protein
MHAENASSYLSEAETCLYQAKNNSILTKHEKRQKKTEGKKLKQEALDTFKTAGEYFEQINLHKNAAQCFYTCKDYEKAGGLFEKAKMFQQAAECLKV